MKPIRIFVLLASIAILISFIIKPEFYIDAVLKGDYTSIDMVLLFMPGFFLLMGLIEVWFPKDKITKYLGVTAEWKGSVYSFLLGSILPGPLYLAFPLAALLMQKGVSRFNVALFVGAWASFKIGEEVFELEFLGLRFLLLRVFVSIPFVVIIAYIIGKEKVQTKVNT